LKIYDYHLHSNFSFDARFSMDALCRSAIKRRASGITFTDHIEYGFEEDLDYELDLLAYQEAIERLRVDYPELQIGMGAEIGLQKHTLIKAQEATQSAPWDFIIASAHMMDGRLLYNGEFTRGKKKKEIFSSYFQGLYELARDFKDFDVMGHIDLLRRDPLVTDKSINWQDYPDELDALFKVLIESGRGFEINTAGWRYGLGGPHPDKSLLLRYRELGGEIITCGSDAHNPDYVASKIEEAYELLRECGFRYVSLFCQRRLQQLPLD